MRNIIKYISCVILVLTLPGCSMFIPDCTKLSGDPLAYRQCIASQGNTNAQYELGVRAFEEQDYPAALKWLKLAAAPNSGRTAVYMPPVGGQAYGTVMMMDSGLATAGHAGAQSLLAQIYDGGLGVKANPEKADHYRAMARRNSGLGL